MAKIDLGRTDPGITGDRENDAWYLRRLCDASFNNDIELITSTITIAECYHAGEDGKISDKAKALFNKFLTSNKVVKTVAAEMFVAERARDLYWKDHIKLSGADAIHVASAIIMNCSEFITTDEKLLRKPKFKDSIPRLLKLGIRVIRASDTNLLPMAYRQDTIELNGSGEHLEEEASEHTEEV